MKLQSEVLFTVDLRCGLVSIRRTTVGDTHAFLAMSSKSDIESEAERGLECEVVSFKFKKASDRTRIQIIYHDGARSIIRDPCDSKFCKILLEHQGNTPERAQALRSLKKFSRFLLDHNVEVSAGLDCWNLFCSGRDCGIIASRGVLFTPPEDIELYGNRANTLVEQGHDKVHLTAPKSRNGRITNLIKLRKGRLYLIAGDMDATTPPNPVSFRPRPTCECEQCTEGGVSRDLEEAIINPLEILSQRYQSSQVAAQGMWSPAYRALVYQDGDGTHKIRGYLAPDIYSEYVCDLCKEIGRVTRCGDKCLERLGRRNAPELDIVEPGSAAVVGKVLEFCRPRFKKLAKSLKRVTERLDTLGVRQGGEVLSEIARLVRATRMEDIRGRWDSCETLTGSELVNQIFFVDEAGTWIMVGTGDKYGVSLTDSGTYHLVLGGGQSMIYEAQLDTQQFGGAAV